MNQQATRMVSGSEATRAAQAVSDFQMQRNQWPYWWSYPPSDAIRVSAIQSIPAPAAGVQSVVLEYAVPSGFQFVWTHLVQTFQGQVYDLGDITWLIDKNTPLGIPITQSSFVQGFYNIRVPLGSIAPQYSEFPLECPDIFAPEDIIRSKVTVSPNINAGYFTTILKGWLLNASR